MAKKKTLGKYKKDLWKVYSLYIKLKDSEDGTTVKCYTCDKQLEIGTSNCQGGHCLPKGGYPYLYFEENNTKPQCYHCNINLSGNTAVFIERLKSEIGEEAYIKMYNSRHGQIKRTISDYIEMISEYKEKIINFNHS